MVGEEKEERGGREREGIGLPFANTCRITLLLVGQSAYQISLC